MQVDLFTHRVAKSLICVTGRGLRPPQTLSLSSSDEHGIEAEADAASVVVHAHDWELTARSVQLGEPESWPSEASFDICDAAIDIGCNGWFSPFDFVDLEDEFGEFSIS
jgi:hypothetical protein